MTGPGRWDSDSLNRGLNATISTPAHPEGTPHMCLLASYICVPWQLVKCASGQQLPGTRGRSRQTCMRCASDPQLLVSLASTLDRCASGQRTLVRCAVSQQTLDKCFWSRAHLLSVGWVLARTCLTRTCWLLAQSMHVCWLCAHLTQVCWLLAHVTSGCWPLAHL